MTRYLLLLPLLPVFLLAACGEAEPEVADRPTATPTLAAPTESAQPGARTVEDMAGRLVELPEAIDTVVTLSGTATELALELGLEVIGRPSDIDGPAAALEATEAGSTLFPDFTAAADLAPDLVIADAAFHEGRRADFARFPVPVFMVNIQLLEDVPRALETLGEATNHQAEATTAVDAFTTAIEDVKANLPEGRDFANALILSGAGRDIYAASNSTYISSMVAYLDAFNVLGDDPEGAPIPGFGLVEIASSAATDPDLVLMLESSEDGIRREILGVSSWDDKKAVVNDRLYALDTDTYLRVPGPRAPEALAALALLLYPE